MALDCYCKLKVITVAMEWFQLLRKTKPYGVHSTYDYNYGGPFRSVSGAARWARSPVFVERRRLRNPRYLSETAGQTSDCTEGGGDVCLSNRWVSILFTVLLNVRNTVAVGNGAPEYPLFFLPFENVGIFAERIHPLNANTLKMRKHGSSVDLYLKEAFNTREENNKVLSYRKR